MQTPRPPIDKGLDVMLGAELKTASGSAGNTPGGLTRSLVETKEGLMPDHTKTQAVATRPHPIFEHTPPGVQLVFPFSVELLTWGDIRELAALGAHYPDDAGVTWDWTTRYELRDDRAEPDGIRIERPDDL